MPNNTLDDGPLTEDQDIFNLCPAAVLRELDVTLAENFCAVVFLSKICAPLHEETETRAMGLLEEDIAAYIRYVVHTTICVKHEISARCSIVCYDSVLLEYHGQ